MGAERSTAHTANESPRDLHHRESLPNTAIDTARDVFRTLIGAGIRDLVLSPGSRSAPLAYAAAEAETSGKLRIHVRIDERSAGFLALGMAQAPGPRWRLP
nr:thiamine pyrophosphate-binding protein [Arthrobacter sp. JCM 19049]